MKSICVVGVGYVGLVTAAAFADLGNRVTALDISDEKIAKLQQGIMPIYEPGLAEMVERNVNAGRLSFTTSYAEGLKEAEFVFICVGTPEGVDGEADLQYVRMAAETIAVTMDHEMIVINKSTVPVGTGDWVADIIREKQPTPINFAVVSCPEFLREGSAISDFLHPDRTVLGSENREAAEAVARLHLPLRAPIVVTDLRTAEMIKYASNAFLATKISFINEIANICESLGADVEEVARGMGFDKRIGPHFLSAGIGYGGSCFAPDETIFVLNSPHVAAARLDDLFASCGEPFQGDAVEVVVPQANQRVMAFDLETGRPTLAEVQAITRRPYRGRMVHIQTAMGRALRVTADHPVILDADPGFRIVPAVEVRPGDRLMTLLEVPGVVKNPDDLVDSLCAVSPIAQVESEVVDMMVYSLETSTGTVIGASGLVLHNCFPKDVKALAHMAQVRGKHPQLLHAVMEINAYQRKVVVLKLRELLGENLAGLTIGLLGLAFKPGTDDLREAPALEVAELLRQAGATVRAYDPVAMDNVARAYPWIALAKNAYALVEGCDAAVVMTEWNEFKQLDMARVKQLLRQPVLVDGRNIYDPAYMHELGFRYRAIGRGYNGEGARGD